MGMRWNLISSPSGLFLIEGTGTHAAELDGQLVILDETGSTVWVWDPEG